MRLTNDQTDRHTDRQTVNLPYRCGDDIGKVSFARDVRVCVSVCVCITYMLCTDRFANFYSFPQIQIYQV